MSRHVVVMVTTSYPRFPGDTVGTFMEPIARGIAARGHEVHLVAPWHPLVRRAAEESGVRFHFFRYAPVRSLNVFGYAAALEADVRLRQAAWLVAPLALLAGWHLASRVARACGATVMHGHWVVPGGVIAGLAAGRRPLVVSLHGSDVYVAERHRLATVAARRTFRRAAWVTACSGDLRDRAVALGARPDRSSVVPYGVDTERFRPDQAARAEERARLGLDERTALVFAGGRLVSKKGFEYLLEAMARLAERRPAIALALAGGGDLDEELRRRAAALGIADRVRFLGTIAQDRMPGLLAAADVAAVPSVRDDEGNVDGLPNVVMEALASGTPLVATSAGGIAQVVENGGTGVLVPERDAAALAGAIEALLGDPDRRAAMGGRARAFVEQRHTWARTAADFDAVYDRVTGTASVDRSPRRSAAS
jgi:glycosyltransferase involved in cell wall biosynthesis